MSGRMSNYINYICQKNCQMKFQIKGIMVNGMSNRITVYQGYICRMSGRMAGEMSSNRVSYKRADCMYYNIDELSTCSLVGITRRK